MRQIFCRLKIIYIMKKYLYVILCCLLSFPIAAMAEPYNLEGVVLDETGETLPGVSILVKGTQRGGTTDVNGIFNIQVSNGETLVFSYVGYATKSVKIAGQKSLEVKLEISQDSLDEVIVVGYGTQSKRTVTSSIASVNGSTLEGSPINTAGEGLKGKIAGVRVYNANNSPGAEATFIVRGGSSISQNNEPLILVDGIERSMEGINPNDIESIEVLKDAASSAIYGSRASNGVVLITTKKGAPGRMRITFEASFAHEDVERMIDYLPADVAVPLMRDRWSTGPSLTRILTMATLIRQETHPLQFIPHAICSRENLCLQDGSLVLTRWILPKPLFLKTTTGRENVSVPHSGRTIIWELTEEMICSIT